MDSRIIKGSEVVRPTTTPLTSSVLAHATVRDLTEGDHFGLRNHGGLWNSYNCLDTLVPTALCPEPTVDKTFNTVPWIPGFAFAYQAGVECQNVGLDQADQEAEVKRVFALNEGKGIEMALLLNRFVERTLVPGDREGVEWDAPVDLTPGALNDTEISPQVALALLEGHAAATYAGQPTIHMPRAMASFLGADKIVWEGDKAFTRSGAKVAMGGGYDGDLLAADGKWDLYATGEVYVERSEQIDIHSNVVPGDGTHAAGRRDNATLTLAERMYRVGVDCFVAKATGTVWS